jgi:hypothetical protein
MQRDKMFTQAKFFWIQKTFSHVFWDDIQVNS